MTTRTEELTISREAVERLSARYGEPAWLLQRRLEAWRLFEQAPMPDPLSEEWKRFPTERLTLEGLLPYAAGAGGARPVRAEAAGAITQVDSAIANRELGEELARQGVVLSDLHTAAREHEALVREHLLSLVGTADWKYLSLHGALWSGGALIYVPEGVEVALPLEYWREIATPQRAVFPH